MTSSQTWIIQDPGDQLNFRIEVNEDPSLLGAHALTVEVTSVDYPYYIDAKMIEVPISVVCTNQPIFLSSSWSTPSIWVPESINDAHFWDLPSYWHCLKTTETLRYEFYASGDAPSDQLFTWLEANQEDKKLSAALSQEVFEQFAGTELIVIIKAVSEEDLNIWNEDA